VQSADPETSRDVRRVRRCQRLKAFECLLPRARSRQPLSLGARILSCRRRKRDREYKNRH